MYCPACVCKTNLDTALRIFSLFRLRTGEPMASSSVSFSENKKGQMICNCPGKTVYLSATTLSVHRIRLAKASAITLSVRRIRLAKVQSFLFKGDNIGFSVRPSRKGKCDNAVCPSYPSRKGKCNNAVCPSYLSRKGKGFFVRCDKRGFSASACPFLKRMEPFVQL